MNSLILFLTYILKAQSSNIIPQCFPCVDPYAERDRIVYFLNLLWCPLSEQETWAPALGRGALSIWPRLGFLMQLSSSLSLPGLYLNSVESMCHLRKITVDNSVAFLPSLAGVIGINDIFTLIYEYVLIVVGS